MQAYFDSWMLRWQEDKCRDSQWVKYVFACPSAYAKGGGTYPSASNYPKPEFILFMIKYATDTFLFCFFVYVTKFLIIADIL